MLVVFALAVSVAAAAAPPASSPARVDTLLATEWRKARVRPAPLVDDAGFLRRVYLDLAGTIPPPEVVRAFLDDRAPDKRVRLVDALLDGPRYADHFTDYWDRVLLGRDLKNPFVDRVVFRAWLHDQLGKNAGWDAIARELLSAAGRNSEGGARNPAQRARAAPDAGAANGTPVPIVGAVNFLLAYVQRPEDLAGKYARIFLGVQVQCAQCHNHPSEKWKQTDFRSLAACFLQARARPADDTKMGVRRVDLIDGPAPRLGPKQMVTDANALLAAAPALLDGTNLAAAPVRRARLAEWTVAPENPWFARAVVNRYWAYFLGRGFVEPIDDFRKTNPAQAPAILDDVSAGFVAHHFDLKWLIRTITATRAYQLSPAGRDVRLWADYRLRPLDADELLAALAQATRFEAATRAPRLRNLFSFLFDVDDEAAAETFSGTVPQALFFLNGPLVHFTASARPGTPLAELLAMPVSDAAKVDALYVRALSRLPTPAEEKRAVAYVAAVPLVIICVR